MAYGATGHEAVCWCKVETKVNSLEEQTTCAAMERCAGMIGQRHGGLSTEFGSNTGTAVLNKAPPRVPWYRTLPRHYRV
ncbi:uncharacterized protein TrAtP1_006992 [Trichoderma atroviride]|uniref:uncharacterized protein n=1 Tax=Hypocrea atroviridis TaxID=63577 RepID=UPI0033345716|nr:hypothetical protein TrAtP1_006992 [Trichoderma atroviride]